MQKHAVNTQMLISISYQIQRGEKSGPQQEEENKRTHLHLSSQGVKSL